MMTEQEMLLVMTIMALLDKPASVQKIQEAYIQQKQILAETLKDAAPARSRSAYEQKGVRIIGMEND
jgi:hypothetical protein